MFGALNNAGSVNCILDSGFIAPGTVGLLIDSTTNVYRNLRFTDNKVTVSSDYGAAASNNTVIPTKIIGYQY